MHSLKNFIVLSNILLIAFCLFAKPFAVQAQGDLVILYITDFGINQWNDDLELGHDFRYASNRVFPDLPSASQILIPMPADLKSSSISEQSLRHRIADMVTTRIQAGLDRGLRTFEIQLVQNINTGGYVDADRQRRVNRFGKTAYSAIGDAITTLRARDTAISSYAITGSNGTKVLTENVDSLYTDDHIYLDGVDLFDGRAFQTPTRHLIEAIGPEKVRIFNTRGDYPAPYTPIGFRSIGSFDTAVDLKDTYPDIKTYLLAPMDLSRRFGAAHVSGIRLPEAKFSVSEYLGGGYLLELDHTFSGRDLRPGPAAHSVNASPDRRFTSGTLRPRSDRINQEFIRADYDRVAEFATAVFAYANVLEEAHESALEQIPFFRNTKLSPRELALLKAGEYLANIYDLSEAINQDLDEHRHGRYVFMRSRTLEALGRFGLKTIASLDLDKKLPLSPLTKGLLTRSGGFQELLTGLVKHAGSGEADLDIVTHYINGIKALAKFKLKQRSKLTGHFALLDGFQELATAGYQHGRQKRLDVDLVTQYLDAANNLAWTGLGLVACSGHYGCTAAIQTFGTTVAKVARSETEGLFERSVLLLRKQDQTVINQWMTLQQRNIASGIAVQKLSEVYGVELLKQNGLTDTQIREFDRIADEFAVAYRQEFSKPSVSHEGTEEERGGVDLAVEEPSVVETNFSKLRDSVLNQRPQPDSLARDFGQ